MSMKLRKLSEPKEADSKAAPNRKLQISVLLVIGLAVVAFNVAANYKATPDVVVAAAPSESPTPTLEPEVVVVTATPTPTQPSVFPSPEPIIVEVTREVPGQPVYFEVPVEVTRIVEVTAVPTSTPALAPGTLRICAHVEGARELFIAGLGVVSGGCHTLSFGVGQTSVQVQVNR